MFNDREREQAMFDSIKSGNWDQAIHHAKFIPSNWDPWQRMPSSAPIPDDAVHKILDTLIQPGKHRQNLPSFLYEFTHNLPKNTSPETLNRLGRVIADHVPGSWLEADQIMRHPNFKLDEDASSLKRAADFWHEYEKDVLPHHFATIKSMYTGKPEDLVDHRGKPGTSNTHVHLIPDLKNYAKVVQDKILKDASIPKRHFSDEPYIQVHRGVGGHYGQILWDKANYDPRDKTIDNKRFKIPTAHLTSWTTDPNMAARFAWGRGEIEGQPKNRGVVLSQWVPVKNVLHSGIHQSVIGQSSAHPEENEIVMGHPEGKFTISTSSMQFQQKPNGSRIGSSNNYGVVEKPTVRKSENESNIIDLFDTITASECYPYVLQLDKSMKNKIIPAATALALLGAPQEMTYAMPVEHMPSHVQQLVEPEPVQSLKPEPLHSISPDLRAIKMIESSGNENHREMKTGPHAGTRAYGKFGLMPMTIVDLVSKNQNLSSKYPDLKDMDFKKDHEKIHSYMKNHPNAEIDIANTFWKHLGNVFEGNTNKMAHAWLNGIEGTRKVPDDQIVNHPYVQKFNKYKKMMDLEHKPIKKSELPDDKKIHIGKFTGFTNVHQDENSIKQINEAIKSGQLHNLSNVGKFTHSSFIAGFDPDNSWLIKIEPFGQRAKSESVNYGLQTIKEAAFYKIASHIFNLNEYTPYAILGELEKDDGHIPAVAIKMYPKVFVSAVDMERSRPHSMRGILDKYRRSGDLHKMAIMLYVLGDADSHGNNVMTDGSNVRLIDHGTSFADMTFDPVHDDSVFVPYILRSWGYKDSMSLDEKMKSMPRIDSKEVKNSIKHWLFNLPEHELQNILEKFSIDPNPSIRRLKLIKKMSSVNDPDYVIDYLWTHGTNFGAEI